MIWDVDVYYCLLASNCCGTKFWTINHNTIWEWNKHRFMILTFMTGIHPMISSQVIDDILTWCPIPNGKSGHWVLVVGGFAILFWQVSITSAMFTSKFLAPNATLFEWCQHGSGFKWFLRSDDQKRQAFPCFSMIRFKMSFAQVTAEIIKIIYQYHISGAIPYLFYL